MSFEALVEIAADVGQLLVERGESVAVSESSSGGLVSAALLAVPGASRYYLGGGVIYTGPVRAVFLQLPTRLPSAVRSSSEPYAALCAATIADRLSADWGLAETGAAGPNGNRYGDASGHTCIAVIGPGKSLRTVETGQDDRLQNMYAFAEAALADLGACLRAA
ncbi:MAG: CinA family protein [Chromatiales bacterium]|jgi:nicotinamide-nucleotide amidase|nr:CinA family protein [Chromatiales bacterium]